MAKNLYRFLSVYLTGPASITICQKTHCRVKRFRRKANRDSKKVSQIKEYPQQESASILPSRSWRRVPGQLSIDPLNHSESPHKSFWLKLEESIQRDSHQKSVKHSSTPARGIKIDLPVTPALLPWPSVDRWFKCVKVEIIMWRALWCEVIGWAERLR